MNGPEPLVSLCVKFRNQRRFVRDALAGAFAQTYRPLEIVVSDDASTDGTWDEIVRLADAYAESGGDIPVVLNRNQSNLGNLGNWQKLCSLAKGELLVKADGDDVSLPERCEKIAAAWIAGGRSATSVSHGAFLISPRGFPLGPMPGCASTASPLGAAMAFSHRVFLEFGEPDDPRTVDDYVYAKRAAALGPGTVIPDRLVEYRLGTGITSSMWRIAGPLARSMRETLAAASVAAKDLERLPDDARKAAALASIERDIRIATGFLRLWEARSRGERKRAAADFKDHPQTAVWSFFVRALSMPRPVALALLAAYAAARNAVRFLKGAAKRRPRTREP